MRYPVEALGKVLPVRIAYILVRSGIQTPEQVERMTDAELLAIQNLGVGTLAKIRAILPHHGARLVPNPRVAEFE